MGGNQSTSGSDKSSKKTEDSKTDSPINQTSSSNTKCTTSNDETSSSNTKCTTSFNQTSSSNTKCTTLEDGLARVPSQTSTSEYLDFTYPHLSIKRLCDEKISEISFM